jgi:hypothetical protein
MEPPNEKAAYADCDWQGGDSGHCKHRRAAKAGGVSPARASCALKTAVGRWIFGVSHSLSPTVAERFCFCNRGVLRRGIDLLLTHGSENVFHMVRHAYAAPFVTQNTFLVNQKGRALNAANLFAVHFFHANHVEEIA